jgi:hypothetical protein
VTRPTLEDVYLRMIDPLRDREGWSGHGPFRSPSQ